MLSSLLQGYTLAVLFHILPHWARLQLHRRPSFFKTPYYHTSKKDRVLPPHPGVYPTKRYHNISEFYFFSTTLMATVLLNIFKRSNRK